MAWRTSDEPKTPHTCNPNRPGMPLPFGQRDPKGKCLRCKELDRGAERRSWGRSAKWHDEQRALEIRRHFAPGGPHSRETHPQFCTFGDW